MSETWGRQRDGEYDPARPEYIPRCGLLNTCRHRHRQLHRISRPATRPIRGGTRVLSRLRRRGHNRGWQAPSPAPLIKATAKDLSDPAAQPAVGLEVDNRHDPPDVNPFRQRCHVFEGFPIRTKQKQDTYKAVRGRSVLRRFGRENHRDPVTPPHLASAASSCRGIRFQAWNTADLTGASLPGVVLRENPGRRETLREHRTAREPRNPAPVSLPRGKRHRRAAATTPGADLGAAAPRRRDRDRRRTWRSPDRRGHRRRNRTAPCRSVLPRRRVRPRGRPPGRRPAAQGSVGGPAPRLSSPWTTRPPPSTRIRPRSTTPWPPTKPCCWQAQTRRISACLRSPLRGLAIATLVNSRDHGLPLPAASRHVAVCRPDPGRGDHGYQACGRPAAPSWKTCNPGPRLRLCSQDLAL